jgi:hypothetical protein
MLLPSIPARNNFSCGMASLKDPVYAESICTARQHDIASMHVLGFGCYGDYHVVIKNIRLHASAMRAEAHFRAASEKRLANRGELRGVPLFDGSRLPHSRWPPRRFHRGEIGKWNRAPGGRLDPENPT